MITLTVLIAVLFSCLICAIVAGVEAFPVSAVLYWVVTKWLVLNDFTYWKWYLICAAALFIINLVFGTGKSNKSE